VAEPKPTLPLYLAWRSDHEGNALAWFLERLTDDELGRRLLGRSPRGQPRRTAGARLRRG
jgi:hypothetical protein